jgi:hypothetical protein
LLERGNTKLDLPNCEALSTEEVYVGHLSRLNTSRDMEASLVQIMKEKYEVYLTFSPIISLYVAPHVLTIGKSLSVVKN